MVTVRAHECPFVRHDYHTSLNGKHLAVEQSVRHLTSSRFDDPPEGGSGNAHACGRTIMVEALEIREADGLQLVEPELNLLKPASGNTGGLEHGGRGPSVDAATFLWPGHFRQLL
jgi:hypothetical protein